MSIRTRLRRLPRLEPLEQRTLLSNGDLDPTFGVGGLVHTDFPSPHANDNEASAVLVQPDGKIVAVGDGWGYQGRKDALVIRYTPAGALDPTFALGGKAALDLDQNLGGTDDRATAALLQPDGKVLVGGYLQITGGSAFCLARLTPDGYADASFGHWGRVNTWLSGTDNHALAVAVQADGKIILAGSTDSGAGADFVLVRYNVDGSPDWGFGGGQVVTDFGSGGDDVVTGVAVQADGKIVAAGYTTTGVGGSDFALARYNPNGSLDTSFGSQGKVMTDFAGGADVGRSLVFQADGKILVAGSATVAGGGTDVALARYNPDGSLDPTFDGDGRLTTDFGGPTDAAYAVAVQTDGKVVVTGSTDAAGGTDFLDARYNPDGSLDAGFGTGGKVMTDFGGSADGARGVALQTDGKIVAAGATNAGRDLDFAVARYNPGGSLDAGFGTGGKVVTDYGDSLDSGIGVAVQADGKFVAVGYESNVSSYDFALARYNPDGSLDSTFGNAGRVATDPSVYGGTATGVQIQADGRILVCGASWTDPAHELFTVVRYNADGSLDGTFGSGGVFTLDFGDHDDAASAMAIQSDGRIVAVGTTRLAAGADIALVRLNADGNLDPSFGTGGQVVTDLGHNDTAADVVLQPDGKIVVAGGSYDPSTNSRHSALLRYNPDGSLDASFAANGVLLTDVSVGHLVLQPDGKLVEAGNQRGPDGTFLVVRFNADGSPDGSFGANGQVVTNIGTGTDDYPTALQLQPDGKLVALGNVSASSPAVAVAAVRYNTDGSLDPDFGTNGVALASFGLDASTGRGVLQTDGKIVLVGTSYAATNDSNFTLARFIGRTPGLLTYQASAGQDVTLRRHGANLEIVASANPSTVVAAQACADVTAVTVTGTDGAATTLRVDFSTGAITVPGGITFTGGAGGSSRLVLQNGSFLGETDTPSGPNAGTIVLDGLTLTYAGVQDADDTTTAASFTFNGGFAGDAVNLVAGPAADGAPGIALDSGTGTFLPWMLAHKAALIVNGGGGNDTITVGAPGASLASLPAVLTVNGQAGRDTLIVNDQGTVAATAYALGADTLSASTLVGPIHFGSVETVKLNAGKGNDTITLLVAPTLALTVNGGLGHDTLVGPNRVNTWQINVYGGGRLGQVTFQSMEDLVGGPQDDTFVFADGKSIAGTIDGGGGSDTLDYSAYTSGLVVNLAAGTATGTGGIRHIVNVFGGSGNDQLTGDSQNNVLFGNAGDDVLVGGGGNDILVGGDGNDRLTAGNNRSLLIGGLGSDTLVGGQAGDLLIGGTTVYDASVADLQAILREWKRQDADYATRIAHLRGTLTGGLNGTRLLNATTVQDDGVADAMHGGGSLDWFWGNVAEIDDLASGEQVN